MERIQSEFVYIGDEDICRPSLHHVSDVDHHGTGSGVRLYPSPVSTFHLQNREHAQITKGKGTGT